MAVVHVTHHTIYVKSDFRYHELLNGKVVVSNYSLESSNLYFMRATEDYNPEDTKYENRFSFTLRTILLSIPTPKVLPVC